MSRGNHFSRLRPLSFMYFIYKAMQICFIGGQLVSKNVNGVTLEFDDLRKTHTAPKCTGVGAVKRVWTVVEVLVGVVVDGEEGVLWLCSGVEGISGISQVRWHVVKRKSFKETSCTLAEHYLAWCGKCCIALSGLFLHHFALFCVSGEI